MDLSIQMNILNFLRGLLNDWTGEEYATQSSPIELIALTTNHKSSNIRYNLYSSNLLSVHRLPHRALKFDN